jgi:hypothetical protein
MAPKSTAGRIAAVLYLVACLGVLVLAVLGREFRDTDIVVVYAMLVLSFPIGYAVAFLFVPIAMVIESAFGVIVPGGLVNNVCAIVIFAAAGYAQWFVLVPWLYRKVKVPSNNALERT